MSRREAHPPADPIAPPDAERDIVKALLGSTELVKEWSQSRVASGQTLAEALTLEGIPLWDMFAVDLARMHVPHAMAGRVVPRGISDRIRPYLSHAKQRVLDRARHRRDSDGCIDGADGHILCLGFSHYIYRDVLRPVAERLSTHTKTSVVSLSDRSWREVAASANGPTLQTIWQHWDRAVDERVLVLRRALAKAHAELRLPVNLPRIVTDGKRGLWERLERVFDWFFRVHVPRILPAAAVARHMLENHTPGLVISADVADPRTRVYTLLCQRMGIPSLEVQFGPIGEEGIEWRFLAGDRVAAWGDTSRDSLIAQGVPAERIAVTGSPRHDSFVDLPLAEVKARRAALGVPAGHVMVLLASAYQLTAYNEYSDPGRLSAMKCAVFEAADQIPGLCLIVKPHPLEVVAETKALSGRSRNVVFVEQTLDIRELIRMCDAFVSFGSTATADALIARKITICPVFDGYIWNLFDDCGAAVVPRTPQEIQQIFQSIVSGGGERILAGHEPARHRFVEQWVCGADGQASARIASLAATMVQQRPRVASAAAV